MVCAKCWDKKSYVHQYFAFLMYICTASTIKVHSNSTPRAYHHILTRCQKLKKRLAVCRHPPSRPSHPSTTFLDLAFLSFLRRLLLQVLHVGIVVVHLLLVGCNVAFTVASQILSPSPFALLLLLQLLLLCFLNLFWGTVGVFLDEHAWCRCESATCGEGRPNAQGTYAGESAGSHCRRVGL